jgi:hypothetical protein
MDISLITTLLCGLPPLFTYTQKLKQTHELPKLSERS